MNPDSALDCTRRHFFSRGATGIGVAALASLFQRSALATQALGGLPHFAPTAKRVIMLHQSGGPSQIDLFDYKPALQKRRGIELPDSVRMGQRITGMTSGQGTLPIAPSMFEFKQYGKSGRLGERVIAAHREDRRRYHDHQDRQHRSDQSRSGDYVLSDRHPDQPGRPSIGSWISYGLGSENDNLPAFVVLLSQAHAINTDQPLFSRLWCERISAVAAIKACDSAPAAIRCFISTDPPGIIAVDAPAHARCAGGAEQIARRAVWRPGDPDAHRASTKWRTACRPPFRN